MAVKIRLQRKGRTKRPFYHIVVADARAPRDGRFIEKLGVYNPMTKPATIELDQMRAYEWLTMGAQPTDTARAILRFKGVLKYKHLMRGVKKGALTQEEADAQWKEWIAQKEAKVAARKEATEKEQADWLARIDGTVKAVKKAESTVSADDEGKNPQAVAQSQKTLAELAAESAPAELEITEEKPVQEEAQPARETAEAEAPADQVEEEVPVEEPKSEAPAEPAEEAAPAEEEPKAEAHAEEPAATEAEQAQSEDDDSEVKSEEE